MECPATEFSGKVIQMERLSLTWNEDPDARLTRWSIRGIASDGSFYGDVKGTYNNTIAHRTVAGTLDTKAVFLINESVAVIESLGCSGADDAEFNSKRMDCMVDSTLHVLYSCPLEWKDESESGKTFMRIVDVLRPVINSVVEW